MERIKEQEIIGIESLANSKEVALANIKTSTQKEFRTLSSNLRIVLNPPKKRSCKDPESGKSNTCQCKAEEVLLGVVHFDVFADDKSTEKVTGIVCAKIDID